MNSFKCGIDVNLKCGIDVNLKIVLLKYFNHPRYNNVQLKVKYANRASLNQTAHTYLLPTIIKSVSFFIPLRGELPDVLILHLQMSLVLTVSRIKSHEGAVSTLYGMKIFTDIHHTC